MGETRSAADMSWRTGLANDIHAYAAEVGERPLVLAGLTWPGQPPLIGHSDGDAVLHAIAGALLSAAGLGDLGQHFGTDRPEMRDADSRFFVTEALRLVTEQGFAVEFVAVQLIAARPRIAPRRLEAQQVLEQLVGAPVSFTATTADGLGAIGSGEGVHAQAVATLRRPR
ncbi:2-C-methyl-D-erythritol 2,4-cyclodiphosphate synthase [Pseudoclavibacter soli]|uniref:2-C-methyl-D-erythritol 2,4-cyclodiphosphate synthase n=1 Tax=Pseudoclavibacter soli TaxID=452623 RepID=UPI000426858C|nr:2-C-methyl-D-erythritol 2,4-cyclodiphosphate synthase [Pseudoclavibacter soli]